MSNYTVSSNYLSFHKIGTDGYYIPFYFQAAKGVSATISGIQFIPLAFPEVLAIVVAGAIVTKTGHYVGDPKICMAVFSNSS